MSTKDLEDLIRKCGASLDNPEAQTDGTFDKLAETLLAFAEENPGEFCKFLSSHVGGDILESLLSDVAESLGLDKTSFEEGASKHPNSTSETSRGLQGSQEPPRSVENASRASNLAQCETKVTEIIQPRPGPSNVHQAKRSDQSSWTRGPHEVTPGVPKDLRSSGQKSNLITSSFQTLYPESGVASSGKVVPKSLSTSTVTVTKAAHIEASEVKFRNIAPTPFYGPCDSRESTSASIRPFSGQHESFPSAPVTKKFKANGVVHDSNMRITGDDGEAKDDNPGPCGFRTARDQLIMEKNAAGAKLSYSSSNNRSLGLTRRGVNTKFVPPVRGRDDTSGGMQKLHGGGSQSEHNNENMDPRLKHIDPKMVELIESEIMDQGSPVTWDDIAGLSYAKKTIQEMVVLPLLRPDIFRGLRGPPKGLLLFGPPGTGKTLIGKCLASQSGATFFSISASSLTSKWVGEGEKMVRALFAVARCHQPAVVFIDEVDSLLTSRSDSEHESSRRIKTEFLVQLDGAGTKSEDRILIVGATNRPQELDEAARRRFVKRLYIPLPDTSARGHILHNLLSDQEQNLTDDQVEAICEETEGFSGADMTSLCREAALGPIRSITIEELQTISADEVRPITYEDFMEALRHVRPSVSTNDLDMYLKWDSLYGSGLAAPYKLSLMKPFVANEASGASIRNPHEVNSRDTCSKPHKVNLMRPLSENLMRFFQQGNSKHPGQEPEETPFCCDKCGTPHVVNPTLKERRPRGPNHRPAYGRKRLDPETQKLLTLCNACALAMDRRAKGVQPPKSKVSPTPGAKEKYMNEGKRFAETLARSLDDPNAVILFCPRFTSKGCSCIQCHIVGDGKSGTEAKDRARALLQLMNKAQDLRKPSNNGGKVFSPGSRRSKAYEEFVLQKREALRSREKLCEHACQRILLYSNNFLHKQSKNRRIERKRGAAALGKLPDISELPSIRCCSDHCTKLAEMYANLLEQWRKLATSGQLCTRKAIAEMLTPSAGGKVNCNFFIQLVLGDQSVGKKVKTRVCTLKPISEEDVKSMSLHDAISQLKEQGRQMESLNQLQKELQKQQEQLIKQQKMIEDQLHLLQQPPHRPPPYHSSDCNDAVLMEGWERQSALETRYECEERSMQTSIEASTLGHVNTDMEGEGSSSSRNRRLTPVTVLPSISSGPMISLPEEISLPAIDKDGNVVYVDPLQFDMESMGYELVNVTLDPLSEGISLPDQGEGSSRNASIFIIQDSLPASADSEVALPPTALPTSVITEVHPRSITGMGVQM
ncbi:unnamed protein product [Darwinula stevensoni]|uniref:Fidgetin-like protein 1 n=1 Tax=Darwinula stevensoni TaxID=69355 RepID=A0A7R8XKY1_9CRUS|nr:unnamed protein product [Darwinula stevensoni]CAG0895721.1 unnamed protein product [Darwinula stevensoni]